MVVAVVALAGCGGDKEALTVPQPTETATAETTATPPNEPSQSVEEFLTADARAFSLGQLGRMYATLHPEQKKLVSRSEFDECFHASSSAFSGEVVGVNVIDSYNETIEIPGTGKREPSLAVTYRPKLKLDDMLEGGGQTIEGQAQTVHVYKVDGEYAWIIAPNTIEAIENDLPC